MNPSATRPEAWVKCRATCGGHTYAGIGSSASASKRCNFHGNGSDTISHEPRYKWRGRSHQACRVRCQSFALLSLPWYRRGERSGRWSRSWPDAWAMLEGLLVCSRWSVFPAKGLVGAVSVSVSVPSCRREQLRYARYPHGDRCFIPVLYKPHV